MRLILAGCTAAGTGGVAWQTLQYLLGLREMGCDVFYVAGRTPAETTAATAFGRQSAEQELHELFDRYGLTDRWAIRQTNRRWLGMTDSHRRDVIRSADALLAVGNRQRLSDDVRHIACKAFVDTGQGSTHHAADFDLRFTFAMNARAGWLPTCQPIAIKHWPVLPVSAVSGYACGQGIDLHARLWAKSVAPKQLVAASSIHSAEPQLGVIDETDQDVSDDRAFRNHIICSRGEFSTAADRELHDRTGWFSDRSCAFLAAGRPVVTQDTGFSDHLPTGDGLVAFTDPADAAEALARVEADYAHHARAARQIARDCFEATAVLGEMLRFF